MSFSPTQQQIIKNILNNYNQLKWNFESIEGAFNPLVLAGHSDQELRDFNQTIININRAMGSVKRWMEKGGSGMMGAPPAGPFFPSMFGGF